MTDNTLLNTFISFLLFLQGLFPALSIADKKKNTRLCYNTLWKNKKMHVWTSREENRL